MARIPEMIRYAFADTSVGPVVVAMSDAGVVWAAFADPGNAGEADALAALARRFPSAELELAGGDRAAWVSAVVRHAETPAKPGRKPPLDLRGTAFQHEVWEVLLSIPPGSTLSYKDVAERIGRPKAYRAVAQACRANPVGIVVPCHRVVGSDGSMTGYGGPEGVGLKRELLEREGAR
jgi:AraC family transcriptional regulator, regulatory protein of adaptative response / methylated-DNA-[protein]-cysteine methyltransferase